MALPFSSTDYSEPGQNLSFANDISNLQTQINTLASESDAARYGALELGEGSTVGDVSVNLALGSMMNNAALIALNGADLSGNADRVVTTDGSGNLSWTAKGGGGGGSSYTFNPGSGFELCHSVFSGDGLVNLWTKQGMHLNTTMSSLSSNSNGTDLEVFFRVVADGFGTAQIYFKGFNLNKTFDSTAVNQSFTSGSEQYKTTEAGSYVTWPGGAVARPNTNAWKWVFSNSTSNYGAATSLVFDTNHMYGIGFGTGNGIKYSAQVWVKTS